MLTSESLPLNVELADMPYFRPDPERYGGYNKEEELKNAELPPDREPRDDNPGAAKRLEPVDGPETNSVELIEAGEDNDEED